MSGICQQLEIGEIQNKSTWESFLLQCQEKTFLQSWNWGEFEKAMGEKVWRLGIYEKNNELGIMNYELTAVAQVIGVKARRGSFLLLPHGPIANVKCPAFALRATAGRQMSNVKSSPNVKCQILTAIVQKLKEVAQQEKCAFIRIAPTWERTEENMKLFRDLGFKQAPIHTHPELTWILDIGKSEEEILAGMRKTTRYLIKQGLKDRDLEILKSQDVKDIEVFNKLYQETTKRHHFVPFSLNYLKNEFLAFRDSSPRPTGSAQNDKGRSDAVIFLAKYQNEFLASAIVIFWQGIGFYHQGASSDRFPKIPASYLLQWEVIREAKQRGCTTYNFWGITNQNIEISKYRRHPWAGLTLFKTGFGGSKKEYLKTQDLPLSRKYWLTYLFEKIRSKKRGF